MLIPLTQDKFAQIDDADYGLVKDAKWYAVRYAKRGTFYAVRYTFYAGRKCPIAMHRELLGLRCGDGMEVDHADGDGLNNRRENLRCCSRSQNAKNRKKSLHGTTPFKAVYREGRKFRARITVDGVRLHVGTFNTAEEAHVAYVEAARKYHGEFANDGVHKSQR